jgi:hypothetical protein
VKTMPMAEILIYNERIQEMQEILKMSDKDIQFMASVEWSVKCAENRATCHEGTYELSPGSDFMSYYDQTEGQPFMQMLSGSQRDRLRTSLFSNPDHPDLGLVDILYVGNQGEVFSLLLKNLKEIRTDNYWMASSYMSRILLCKHSERLENIFNDFSDIQFDDDDQKKKIMIESFIAEAEAP